MAATRRGKTRTCSNPRSPEKRRLRDYFVGVLMPYRSSLAARSQTTSNHSDPWAFGRPLSPHGRGYGGSLVGWNFLSLSESQINDVRSAGRRMGKSRRESKKKENKTNLLFSSLLKSKLHTNHITETAASAPFRRCCKNRVLSKTLKAAGKEHILAH